MVPKKGTGVPPRGPDDGILYARAISEALRAELGSSHRATKTLMAWTGVSDRTAKYWLSGARGPDGPHLMLLARRSDAVLRAVLTLSQRDLYALTLEVGAARAALLRAVAITEALDAR